MSALPLLLKTKKSSNIWKNNHIYKLKNTWKQLSD